MKSRCGKTKSNSGRVFDEQSLRDHEIGCRDCWSIKWQEQGLDINGRIKPEYENDDEPDGAYWAMKLEGYHD